MNLKSYLSIQQMIFAPIIFARIIFYDYSYKHVFYLKAVVCFNAFKFSTISYRCKHIFKKNLNYQLLFLISHKLFFLSDVWMLSWPSKSYKKTLQYMYLQTTNSSIALNSQYLFRMSNGYSEVRAMTICHWSMWFFRAPEHWKTSVWLCLQMCMHKKNHR